MYVTHYKAFFISFNLWRVVRLHRKLNKTHPWGTASREKREYRPDCLRYLIMLLEKKLLFFDKKCLHFDNGRDSMMSDPFYFGSLTASVLLTRRCITHMDNNKKTEYSLWLNMTIFACGLFFIVILLGDIFGYSVCDYYWQDSLFSDGSLTSLGFLKEERVRFMVFLTIYYLSTALTYPILFCLVSLLRNLKKGVVFDKVNTRYMSVVSVCCFLIAVICGIGTCASTPLCFICLLGMFVGLIVECVRLVMFKAIDMRQELDLTV